MINVNGEEVIRVIEDALQLEKGGLNINSSTANVEGWDSLGHLSILIALDKLFDGKVAGIADMATADSVSKIIQVLKDNSLI